MRLLQGLQLSLDALDGGGMVDGSSLLELIIWLVVKGGDDVIVDDYEGVGYFVDAGCCLAAPSCLRSPIRQVGQSQTCVEKIVFEKYHCWLFYFDLSILCRL